MAETKYPGTFRSGREDKKFAFANNIYDETQNKLQEDINTEVKNKLDDVKDTLLSDSTTAPLSANQGKILKALLDNKVIEAGGVPFDEIPTLHSTNPVTSNGIYDYFTADNVRCNIDNANITDPVDTTNVTDYIKRLFCKISDANSEIFNIITQLNETIHFVEQPNEFKKLELDVDNYILSCIDAQNIRHDYLKEEIHNDVYIHGNLKNDTIDDIYNKLDNIDVLQENANYYTPQFYDNIVLYQNYQDDEKRKDLYKQRLLEAFKSINSIDDLKNISKIDDTPIEGAMLRTDTLVWNSTNLTSFGKTNDQQDMKYLGDSTTNTMYRYFSWSDVQNEKDTYNFNNISDYIIYNFKLGRRVALRLFPSCLAGSNHKTIIYKDNQYIIDYPEYVFNLMIENNAQICTYDSDILLDVNCEAVYLEYEKLLIAFGKWFNTTPITIDGTIQTDINGNTIYMKDAVVYIDFGWLGPWGEGSWYDLKMTASIEDLSRYTKTFLDAVPNTQLNTGVIYEPLQISSNSDKNELYLHIKELRNNIGYLGQFIDNFGSKNPRYFNKRYMAENVLIIDKLKEYADRGDFTTGEFAMWINSNYWGDGAGLWQFNLIKALKLTNIRVHNMTLTYYGNPNKTFAIQSIYPSLYQNIANSISMIGFRFVIGSYSYYTNKILTIFLHITNIGLTKSYFDIYKPYYIIENLETEESTEYPLSLDLCSITPNVRNKPLQFSASDGVVTKIDIDTSAFSKFNVRLVAKDKYKMQTPLYFSNYGRQSDGSYILYSSI